MIVPRPYTPWRQRRVLGWRLDALLGVVLLMAAGIWGAWLTREVLQLQERRVVSVSLQALVGNYVSGAAREGLSETEIEERTRRYLAAVETAMAGLSDGRTTVLVSEAVLGRSVPDVTPAVEAAVARAMKDAGPTVPSRKQGPEGAGDAR